MRKIMVDGFEIDIPALVRLFGWERVFRDVTAKEVVQRMNRQELLAELYEASPEEVRQFVEQHKNNNGQETD